MTALNAVSDFFFPKKKSADEEVISTKKQKEETDFTKLIDKDSLHALFPFSWEQYPTYIQSGENFIRVLAIADYPKRVYGNWLSELKRKKGVIDVVQYIDSASNNSMITYYKKTIQNKEAELLNTFDPYKKKVLQNYIDSQVIKSDITQVELAILDDVVKSAYINSGILRYSRLNEIKNEQWPTLTNVYDELEKLESKDPDKFNRIKDFYYILGSYTNGTNSLFDGHTNVNLKTKIVSFDLKPLQSEQEVQSAAYLNTFQYLWDEITKDRHTRKKLFVDEFHFLTLHKAAATFFHQAYKRFRKYNAGAIAGTQQIQDVIEGTTDNGQNIGEAIIGNSYTKVFFGLDGKGVDDVITKLRMTFSDKEKKLLERRRQGEALMMYGSQRAFMKIELTEEELRLVDPEAYQEKYSREQPDYQSRVVLTPSEIANLTEEEEGNNE